MKTIESESCSTCCLSSICTGAKEQIPCGSYARDSFDEYISGLANDVGNGYASLAISGFDINPDMLHLH